MVYEVNFYVCFRLISQPPTFGHQPELKKIIFYPEKANLAKRLPRCVGFPAILSPPLFNIISGPAPVTPGVYTCFAMNF